MAHHILKKVIIEVKELAILAFCIVFINIFLMSQNKIPSGSMIPTLNVEDRLIVSMIPYYYRSPKRGEIVVFNRSNEERWIKRVVGLPGEVIDIQDGNIYINGKCLDESAYLEEDGISTLNPKIDTVVTYPYTIPEGQYFLLGDNRLESYDCRYIGPIKEGDITGMAVFRIYPLTHIGRLV